MKLPAFLTKKVKPQTVLSGENIKTNFFSNQHRDLKKYEDIYRNGGLISQVIDAYPLFMLSNGYNLTGDASTVKEIEKWLYSIDINRLMWQSIVDSFVYGDSIQENVYGMGGKLLYVVPRNPSYFTINNDKYGIIESYTQTVNNKEVTLKPEQVTHLQLLTLPDEPYGISLIGRSIDEVMRDTRTAESTAIAIERHGYPRFHIKVGSEGNNYSDDEKRELMRVFEELKADNEFITNYDVDILPIDAQGVGKVREYNELSLSRLLAAFGVPSGVIGTGENKTTYASATVEMQSFKLRCETYQKKVARRYNELIDFKTGIPGQVTLEFNPINEEIGE